MTTSLSDLLWPPNHKNNSRTQFITKYMQKRIKRTLQKAFETNDVSNVQYKVVRYECGQTKYEDFIFLEIYFDLPLKRSQAIQVYETKYCDGDYFPLKTNYSYFEDKSYLSETNHVIKMFCTLPDGNLKLRFCVINDYAFVLNESERNKRDFYQEVDEDITIFEAEMKLGFVRVKIDTKKIIKIVNISEIQDHKLLFDYSFMTSSCD